MSDMFQLQAQPEEPDAENAFPEGPVERQPESTGEVLDDEGIPEDLVEKSPIWLVTFGDVAALMLAFFVMLYSMSHLQSEKWDAVISILATRDEPVKPGEPTPVGERTITRIDLIPAFPTGYLERILNEKLGGDPLLADIRMTGLEDQLVLSLPTDKYFDGADATLNETGIRTLSSLAAVFRQFGNRLDIRGHTSPEPLPPDSPYQDRWAVSLARALAVAKSLEQAGYSGDLSVLGQADSVYRHIDRDIPETRRFELARRVDIVIVPEARGQ